MKLNESSKKISKSKKLPPKNKLLLKKEDEPLVNVADVSKYLNDRRSKAKTGIREGHETYILES